MRRDIRVFALLPLVPSLAGGSATAQTAEPALAAEVGRGLSAHAVTDGRNDLPEQLRIRDSLDLNAIDLRAPVKHANGNMLLVMRGVGGTDRRLATSNHL